MPEAEENAIVSETGQVIYIDEIERKFEEFAERIPDKSQLYKPATFSAMLQYAAQKYIIPQYRKIQEIRNGRHEYKLLDKLFSFYVTTCGIYNNTPSVLGFTVFTGIERELLTRIRNGVYPGNDANVNPVSVQMIRRWFDICENVSLTAAANGSIGGMFVLKCCYQYQEASQKIEVLTNVNPRQSAEQIREKYRAAELPALPE